MNDRRALENVLFDASSSRSDKIDAIMAHADADACILDGLTVAAESASWARFNRWLFAASVRPSAAMAPLLCEVLGRRLPEVSNEDLVTVLGDTGDERVVGPIEDAMLWEPDWDEFHALGVKCVWALGAIGTPAARAVIEDAAAVGPEKVRDAAVLELRQMNRSGRSGA
jgi:hypothetical protein